MRTYKGTLIVGVAVLSAMLFGPAAFGQLNKEQPTERRPAARDFLRDRPQVGGMQAMQVARFAFLLERVLTDEQRASLRENMEKQRDKTREIEEKLRDARKDLLQASVAEKFEEEA